MAPAVSKPPGKSGPSSSGAGSGIRAGKSRSCAGRGGSGGERPPAMAAARMYRAFGFRGICAAVGAAEPPPKVPLPRPRHTPRGCDIHGCATAWSRTVKKDPTPLGMFIFDSSVFEAGTIDTEATDGGLWLFPETQIEQEVPTIFRLRAEHSLWTGGVADLVFSSTF